MRTQDHWRLTWSSSGFVYICCHLVVHGGYFRLLKNLRLWLCYVCRCSNQVFPSEKRRLCSNISISISCFLCLVYVDFMASTAPKSWPTVTVKKIHRFSSHHIICMCQIYYFLHTIFLISVIQPEWFDAQMCRYCLHVNSSSALSERNQ